MTKGEALTPDHSEHPAYISSSPEDPEVFDQKRPFIGVSLARAAQLEVEPRGRFFEGFKMVTHPKKGRRRTSLTLGREEEGRVVRYISELTYPNRAIRAIAWLLRSEPLVKLDPPIRTRTTTFDPESVPEYIPPPRLSER